MLSSALFALVSAGVASATKSLSISTYAPASLTDVSALEVVTTITNTGDETVTLLNDPRTVLSSWATQSFIITGESGVEADFTGVAVRYIPEVVAQKAEKSVTVLAAGESVDVTHEVGNFYNFTSAGEGAFTVTPLTSFHAIEEDGSLTTIEATSSTASLRLTGTLSSPRRSPPARSEALPPGRAAVSVAEACPNARPTTPARARARRRTPRPSPPHPRSPATSVSHLQSNPSGSTLQTTWYGTFASSRYSGTVASFKTLVSEPASWWYDCTCTDSDTYAYVYPSSYGEVYLCGYYWNAPATGSGSRADTIIHEGTHFRKFLGTDDYAYGESACKSLASSSPAKAYLNADNHAFFSDYV
ncbi:zincin [Hymenopellis radicata]|nr:zincin [Hymenopellis radicata]